MTQELVQFFREIGELTGDASVGRGMVTFGAALAAGGLGLWRWLRAKPARVKVSVDVPSGQYVTVTTGRPSDEA